MQYEPLEQWIWFPADSYPANQTTTLTCMSSENQNEDGHYTVAAFARDYRFDKPIREVHLRTSGDTFFRLYVNDQYTLTGPASVGGDFLENDRPRPQFYAAEVTLNEANAGLTDGKLAFQAVVRMRSLRMFEYSMGHGGFFLTARVTFADGTRTFLRTDETWTARLMTGCVGPQQFDNSIPAAEAVQAVRIPNRWHCLTSPLPPSVEHEITPADNRIKIPAGEAVDVVLPLAMIYTGYVSVSAKCTGRVTVDVRTPELGTGGGMGHHCVFVRDDRWLSTVMTSCGRLVARITNECEGDAEITLSFVATHYPVENCAKCTTSDEELNRVIEVCSHTLKYCRQTLHLDSGSHCEPMACTGDYYIEALMTAMTFGDLRLAAFDVRRTAQLLRYNDGRMFHTTYSLIWVQMLWDMYLRTGEIELLTDCEDALTILLERFAAYIGENGILENPPDYMFIDWLIPDGISTHHPPKALGQTCLNLFYYGALRTAAKISDAIGEPAMASLYTRFANEIQPRIIELLYDPVRSLFFEGLNTPTREDLIGQWMPQNVEKRYYRQHANILAAYFAILPQEQCREILHKVMTEEDLGVVQPYFAHFLLEAIYRNGLRDTWTRPVLEQWKAPVADCPYGLAEGFHKPEPTYSFDHTHAWGGTPSYALPLALSGLEILEPAYGKIRLCPSLLGLTHAYTEIPTPYGSITIEQHAGEAPRITVPAGVTLVP